MEIGMRIIVLREERDGSTGASENACIAYRGRSKFKNSGVIDLTL